MTTAWNAIVHGALSPTSFLAAAANAVAAEPAALW
jgi:hypothetical protein